MRRTMPPVGLVAIVVMLSACASTVPPSRLMSYVGPQAKPEASADVTLPPRATHAGLVVVSDTSAPDAAPGLPEEAQNKQAERLQQELAERLPLVIDRIIPADGIKPDGDVSQLAELGEKYGEDYLVFVVMSSTEQEYPLTLFLGWTTHSQPGWRRDNWSLMEIALFDVKARQVLLYAQGRGFATLDRPAAPGINQWYPVVWLRPQYPSRRYWPPTYAGAPNTLRVIAMNEAARRGVLSFQDAWIERRQAELDSHSS